MKSTKFTMLAVLLYGLVFSPSRARAGPFESWNGFCTCKVDVDLIVIVFAGNVTSQIPDQTAYLHDATTNPFAATAGHTPTSITVSLNGDGNTEVKFRGTPDLTPGGGTYPGGAYHFGLHGSTGTPMALHKLKTVLKDDDTGQTQQVPTPTVTGNTLTGSVFDFRTVYFRYGPTTANQNFDMYWDQPIPEGQAPILRIDNFSTTPFYVSNIRLGPVTEDPRDVDKMNQNNLDPNSFPQFYGGPPILTPPGGSLPLVPEPASVVLLGIATVVTLLGYGRLRQRQAAA
jgi:hypothetical protein